MVEALDLSAFRVRPLRRTEYDRLIEDGSFAGEQVELLYGRVFEMSPQGRAHAFAIQQLTEVLTPPLVGRAKVRVQLPLAASDLSEPEPDIVLAPPGDYLSEHPASAHLVIEVADSSLSMDRGPKRRTYAEAGVPEYWIVNLVDNVVEVYSGLEEGDYAQIRRCKGGDVLRVPGFADVEVALSRILPR